MSFFSEKIREPKSTQIIAKSLELNELIRADILEELREKFCGEGEITATFIRFHIIPKKETPEEAEISRKKRVGIVMKTIDSVALEHLSPSHIEQKVVVVTSNSNKVLDKFLK